MSARPAKYRVTPVTLTLAIALLGAAGCSTEVGKQNQNGSGSGPSAVITVIGQKPTSAAGADPVTVTVRSGADVVLSGKESEGTSAAIASFAWTQTAGPALPSPPDAGALLYRTANTVSFRAPQVPDGTTLSFKLTVTDARGAAATANATVTVHSALDPDQFLSLLATPHFFKVGVATVEGLGPLANPPATLAADVPVCVTVTRIVSYTGRDGTSRSVTLTPLQADASWAAAVGGAPGNFSSYTNPRVAFAIPSLNQDELFGLLNNPVSNGANPADLFNAQLVPSDVDTAQLRLTATAAPGPCGGAGSSGALSGKTLQVQVYDQAVTPVGTAQASVSFTPDMLASRQQRQYETADTARAYYDAIDPQRAKTTLTDWLNANCFDASATNYGADAHAVYTNNFDLGFGRDMYFTACKAGSGRVGDLASVVINYTSLETVALKSNPIIAVAMEFSPAADGSNPTHRFTKFYVFAPDDRDGTFRRVLTANFDRRGEKYIPGACVMCHGGTLPQFTPGFTHAEVADAPYATILDPTQTTPTLPKGDVDSTFMPWDLDSLLYSDTDPAFGGALVAPGAYTRAAQEPSLKKLNQLAYCTWQPEMEMIGGKAIDRLATLRQLVSQWYGGSAAADTACATSGTPTAALLPNPNYSDATPLPGWTGKSVPGATTTLTSDEIYHQVFARHCRACHMQDATINDQFGDYPSFIKFFQPTTSPSGPGLGLQYALKQTRMPLARLTADRFWVSFSGGDSAAKILATHIQQLNHETDLIDGTSGDAATPGKPVLNVAIGNQAADPTGATAVVATRYAGADADALAYPAGALLPSFFGNQYDWTLCLTPPGGATCAPRPLVADTSPVPRFGTDEAGIYTVSLAAANVLDVSSSVQFKVQVGQTRPKFTTACPSAVNAPVGFNAVPALNLGPAPDGDGCIVPGDGVNTLQILDPQTGNWVSPSAAAPLSESGWIATVTGYAIAFQYTGTPTSPVSLSYRVYNVDQLCTAGSVAAADCAANAVQFNFLKNLSDLSLQIHLSNSLGVTPMADATGHYALSTPTLLQGIPAAEVSSLSIVTPPLLGSVTPSSIAATAAFTYTVPSSQPVMCDVNGMSISDITLACAGDPFTYTLTVGAPLTAAKVTAQVLATTSFWQAATGAPSGVYGFLGPSTTTQCAQCHDSTSGATEVTATAQWQFDAASSLNTWQGTGSAQGIRQWAFKLADGTPASPQQSALYQNACNGGGSPTAHTSATQQLDPVTQCPVLLQWITEGANYN